jgi:hypothetical protein
MTDQTQETARLLKLCEEVLGADYSFGRPGNPEAATELARALRARLLHPQAPAADRYALLTDAERDLLAKHEAGLFSQAALTPPGIGLSREQLESVKRLATRQHVRLAEGGGTVPNGWSCALCNAHWGRAEQPAHQPDCVLALTPAASGWRTPGTTEICQRCGETVLGHRKCRWNNGAECPVVFPPSPTDALTTPGADGGEG